MGPTHAALALHPSAVGRFLSSVQPMCYDDMDRQTQYVESALQRRERIAFLKKRECARRVAIWMHQTGFVDSMTPPRRDLHPKPPSWQLANQHEFENEPYIIYTSSPSPRTPLAPIQPIAFTPPPSPRASGPPPHSPQRTPQTRVSPRPSHRRTISLSSISELPEED